MIVSQNHRHGGAIENSEREGNRTETQQPMAAGAAIPLPTWSLWPTWWLAF